MNLYIGISRHATVDRASTTSTLFDLTREMQASGRTKPINQAFRAARAAMRRSGTAIMLVEQMEAQMT